VKSLIINYYDINNRMLPTGDPAVFGFPCRFPAAPSIRPENRVQHIDLKDLPVQGEPRKKIFP
jgi:hypothetical protein